MADSKFKVTIITPDGTVYDNDKATMLIMNTAGGQMGIMANHVPLLASLEISVVRVKHDDGEDEVAAVNGGIIQFDGLQLELLPTVPSCQNGLTLNVRRVRRNGQKKKLLLRRRTMTVMNWLGQKPTLSGQLTV